MVNFGNFALQEYPEGEGLRNMWGSVLHGDIKSGLRQERRSIFMWRTDHGSKQHDIDQVRQVKLSTAHAGQTVAAATGSGLVEVCYSISTQFVVHPSAYIAVWVGHQ